MPFPPHLILMASSCFYVNSTSKRYEFDVNSTTDRHGKIGVELAGTQIIAQSKILFILSNLSPDLLVSPKPIKNPGEAVIDEVTDLVL